MKKTIASILALCITLGLSACGGKADEREILIVDRLESKYGSEFEVVELREVEELEDGRIAEIEAICSPKDDERIVFRARYDAFHGKENEFSDNYIHQKYTRKVALEYENMLKEYFSDFEVNTSALSNKGSSSNGIYVEGDMSATEYLSKNKEVVYSTHIFINENEKNNISGADMYQKLIEMTERLEVGDMESYSTSISFQPKESLSIIREALNKNREWNWQTELPEGFKGKARVDFDISDGEIIDDEEYFVKAYNSIG